MSKFYIPAKGPEAWKEPLSGSGKLWETGYAEKALANCWDAAQGFPDSVTTAFRSSPFELFHKIEFILGVPGHKVELPPKGGPQVQDDLFVLARSGSELVSIIVEGTVLEPFGEVVSEWNLESSYGKLVRMEYLIELLEINNKDISRIRDGYLHQTASALLEARQFYAPHALMLVHAFGDELQWFKDYEAFAALFGQEAKADSMIYAGEVSGINLYLAWVTGEEEFLEK